jgi:hypothetical protein
LEGIAVSVWGGFDGPVPGVDVAEAESAALEVLADVLEWQLPVPRWERVAELVQSIDEAVRGGDLVALESATIDLELLSPVRVTRIGSTQDRVEAPPEVRVRVNRLQHTFAESSARCDPGSRGGGRDQSRDQR